MVEVTAKRQVREELRLTVRLGRAAVVAGLRAEAAREEAKLPEQRELVAQLGAAVAEQSERLEDPSLAEHAVRSARCAATNFLGQKTYALEDLQRLERRIATLRALADDLEAEPGQWGAYCDVYVGDFTPEVRSYNEG